MERRLMMPYILLICLIFTTNAAVIGIDFGTQYFKAVLVKPGSPFNIIENTSSKRKTENGVCFTDDERAFEQDAISQSVSYPKLAFLRSLEILGLEYPENEDDEMLKDLKLTHPNDLLKDERGNIGYEVTIPGDKDFVNIEVFTEEIVAMTLQHLKKLAKNQGSGLVNDITITVPSYFTINQRQMVLDAAHLAGFNVLNLIHENTAAALMYGIDNKNLEFPHKILMVNMGASNLELSIVSYTKVYKNGEDTKDRNSTSKGTLAVEVIDEASVPNVGGYAFDMEIVKIIADRFDSLPQRSGKPSIMENDKILRRLMKEVPRHKEVLSANKEVPIKILEIADGLEIDFVLTRAEFEEKIDHVIQKMSKAFEEIFSRTSIEEIDEVEIIGGGLRVPKVKEFISNLVNDKTLSTHMNPDEAMAFGSAYIAANYSSNYKVQKVFLYQKVPDSIYLNLTQVGGCNTEETEDCFFKHMMLLNETKDNLGTKKTISISNHVVDMDAVLYKIDTSGKEHVLLTGKIRNTDKATSSAINQRDTIVDRKLTISFKYDKSGILSIKKAEAILIEEIEEKPKKKANSTDSDESTAKKPKIKEKTHDFSLKVTEKLHGPQALSVAQKKKATKRLNELEKRDKVQQKLKAIINEYESLIYSSRDYVEDTENEPYFKSQDEKDKILMFINEEADRIYNSESSASDYETYKNKIKVLEKKINPVKKRKTLRQIIPDEIDQHKKELDKVSKSFNRYKNKNSWLPAEDVSELETLIMETKEFLDTKMQELEDIPLNEKLPFTSTSITTEVTRVNTKFKQLKKIRKPKEAQKNVESHGELKEPGSYRIDSFDSSKDDIGKLNDFIKIDNSGFKKDSKKAENKPKTEPEVELEDVPLQEADDENFEESLKNQKLPPNMQDQVNQMLKNKKLKEDLLDGKIDIEDLTPEQLEAINNA